MIASAPEAVHSLNSARSRGSEERFDGDETVRRALRLRPGAMLVEQDVAEDDVRDAVSLHLAQSLAERGVVGRPGAAAGDAAKPEPIGLRVDQLGPQAVRSAALRALVEHGDHADHVVLRVRAVKCGATILAAAPGNGGARLASGQGVLLRRSPRRKTRTSPGPGFLTRGVNPLRAPSQAEAQWRTRDQEPRPRTRRSVAAYSGGTVWDSHPLRVTAGVI